MIENLRLCKSWSNRVSYIKTSTVLKLSRTKTILGNNPINHNVFYNLRTCLRLVPTSRLVRVFQINVFSYIFIQCHLHTSSSGLIFQLFRIG